MKRASHFFLTAFFAIATFASVHGQGPSSSPKSAPAKGAAKDDKAAAREEARRLEEQRRALAIGILNSLADEARTYRTPALRARVQARAADVLWETDVEKARVLFRRAWDAADVADIEAQRKLDEERRAQEQAGKPFSGVAPQSIRTEVLRMAARRDRALGEQLLRKLDEARKQETSEADTQTNASQPDSDPFELGPALILRLRVAQQLLETDLARAIEFADPALTRVSIEGLVFLSYLRAKDAAAADERYGVMLVRSAAALSSDANTVSVLSSYAFTPFFFIRFSPDGGRNTNQYEQATSAPNIAPELRLTFFRVADEIFLRPLSPPAQDLTTSGRIGKYYVMTRLLPFFEQYAPEQSTMLVKGQLTALAQEVPELFRQPSLDGTGSPANVDDENNYDRRSIEAILARIARVRTQEERDQLYAEAAIVAADTSDPRAFDFADKIDDTETRKSVRAFVDFHATRMAIEKKRYDEATKLARNGSLSNIQRVWFYIQLARALIETDRDTADVLLDDALAEARRIGGSSADRPRALVGITTVLYAIDRQRAWDMLAEVARAANNSSEDFSGEDARVMTSLHTKVQTSIMTFTVDAFDLPGIFRLLAKEDLGRSIELAKSFNGESPRATALIAIVRTVLEKKKE